MEVKDIIKNRRLELNLTMLDVAKAVGVAEATVSRWESGNIKNMRREKIAKLAQVLQISPAVIMEWEEPDKQPALPDNVITFDSFKKIPIIGTIACGEPILAEENYEGYTQTESTSQADFALRCKGDSMAPTFMDGDVVLIRQQPVVENGQIAAVLIGSEATLKHVYLSQQDIMLVADNPQYSPIVYTGEQMNTVRIIGLAVGYTRLF